MDRPIREQIEHAYLPPAATAFVILVIVLAPFLALALMRASRLWAGALLLFGSMLGALLFGIAFHYLLPGSDNVADVPPGLWQLPFQHALDTHFQRATTLYSSRLAIISARVRQTWRSSERAASRS